jgi:hypothetical protein
MTTLAEIRQQNPQYNTLSDQDLADRLYDKFYAGKIGREDFYKRVGFERGGPTVDAAAELERQNTKRVLDYLSKPNSLLGKPKTQEMIEATDPSIGRDYIRKDTRTPIQRGAEVVSGFGREAANELLLGGGDEAKALLESILSKGQPSEVFAAEQQKQKQLREQFAVTNPGAATAGAVGGVVFNPLNLIGGEAIAAAPSVLGRTARAAGVGSGVGAVTGGLSTEGGAEDRLTGAGIGAGIGAAAGGAAQPVMELLGFGARKGFEGGRAIYNTIRNQVQARANPQGQADRLLTQAFMDDAVPLGFGPAPVPAPQSGQGLINLGGENVAALGRQATVAPGPSRTRAQQFFEEQRAGQVDRTADELRGLSDRGYYGTVEELDATRRTAARPLYDIAYSQPAVEQWTPRIAELFRRPSMRAALARAQRIAAEEGRDPRELGLTFNDAGDPVFLAGADANGQIPSVQTMDYVKRGLDDVVEQYRDRTTGRLNLDTEGRAINNTRAEFVGIMRQGNPDYAVALDAWAGPSHALDTVELGRDLYRVKGAPADGIRRFQALTPQDQELARIGFMRNAIEDVGQVGEGGSVYQRLFGNPNKRAMFEVMFPDRESFDRFAAAMQRERQMLATDRMVRGGSPTSRIDAEKETFEAATNFLNWTEALRSGNPLRLLGVAADKGRALTRGVTPEVAEALGNRLFTTDPIDIQRILSQAAASTPPPQVPPAQSLMRLGRRTPVPAMFGYGSGQLGAMFASPGY